MKRFFFVQLFVSNVVYVCLIKFKDAKATCEYKGEDYLPIVDTEEVSKIIVDFQDSI